MIALKIPLGADGYTWMVTHRLTVVDESVKEVRPVHVLTYLAPEIVVTREPEHFQRLLYTLENKLFAATQYREELEDAFERLGDPSAWPGFVHDFVDDHVFLCTLEAYLLAIANSLEVAALIACVIRPGLPKGFRAQCGKHDSFSPKTWTWLPRFWEVRAEVTRLGAAFPTVEDGKLVVEFERHQQVEAGGAPPVFKHGRQEIALEEVIDWSTGLFDMLDAWARRELRLLDPETVLHRHKEDGVTPPINSVPTKARDILRLMQAEGTEISVSLRWG